MPTQRDDFFSDLRFSAALFWTMLHDDSGINFVLDIPGGVERDGDTLILNKPEDLPTQARAFGMVFALPLEVIGRDHVWEFRFYRHGSFSVCALNDIPLALLGSDTFAATPLPRSICALSVAWAAYDTLDGIEGSSNIQQLLVQSLTPLAGDALEPLRFLPNLKHLEFVGRSVGEMPCDLLPPSLEDLMINLPEGVEDLAFLPELTRLVSLSMSRCRSLKDLSALENAQGLRDLKLTSATSLTDITAIGNLCWLRTVDLSGATALQQLRPLSFLEGLEGLNLFGCESIRNIRPLAVLEQLRFLDLGGCYKIESFVPLKALPHVEVMMPDWMD